VFITGRHWSLSWARCIQYTASQLKSAGFPWKRTWFKDFAGSYPLNKASLCHEFWVLSHFPFYLPHPFIHPSPSVS